jgi:putative PEP-CTERM system TPR-repeat lipoprotein
MRLRQKSITQALAVVLASTLVAGLPGCARKSPEQLLAEARDYAAKGDLRTASIQLRTLLRDEPGNVEGVLMLADVALKGNNPALAERNYRRAAELGANPSRYWAGQMEALLELGRYEDALAQTRTAAGPRLFPAAADNARQALLRARAQIGLQKLGEAEASLRESLQVAPSAAAHLELARVLAATGRQPEADRQLEAALALEPDDAEALLMQAMRLLADGETRGAEPLLARALEQGQAEGQVLVQAAAIGTLAELDLAAGRIPEAERRAAELQKVVGDQTDVRYLRARIALEQRDLEKAKAELQEILAADKTFAPAQRLLGAIYTLENQFDLAEMFLRPVVVGNPDDLFTRRLLATVLLARNRPAEALPLLENVAAPDEESREVLLGMMGQASLQLGDVARAVSIFREGSRAYPDNPLFELGLGLTMLAEGRTDEASELLRQVRGAEAEATRAAFLTIIYMQKGQAEQALASARSVVEKFPDQAWSHNLLGSVLMATGQFAEARLVVGRAVELDPRDAAALANLARVEELLGNPAAAAVAWRRILEKDPGSADAAFWLARLELDQGNIGEALEVLEPFRKTSSRAQLLVGSILLDRGATGEVRKLAGQVARAEPENAEVWNLLGLTDLASGAPRDAVANFSKAIELRPNSALYRVNLARAHMVAGNDDAAVKAMAGARQLEPGLLQLRSLEFLRFARRGELAAARQALAALRADRLGDETLYASMEAELLVAEKRPGAAADLYVQAYGQRPNLDLAVKAWTARKLAGGTGDTALLVDWQKRNPDDPRAARALGDAYMADGRAADAEAAYEKVLALAPDDVATLNNLAWLSQERGDRRAVDLGARAARLAPESAPVLDTAGWAELRLGDRQRGLKLIRRAAELAPVDRDIQYHLAVALVENGQPAEGRRILAALVESGDPFASRADAEQMLRTM